MSISPISETQAWQIAKEFAQNLNALDPQGVLAVYVIGSLGGGYYRPGHSDIDTVVLLRDGAALSQAQAEQLAEGYQERYAVPKGFGVSLVRERELLPPYLKSQEEEFEFSLEIARLKTQSKPVLGGYDLSGVPMPGRLDLIQDARIMEAWFEREYGANMFERLDETSCVNSILLYLKRYLMIEKGLFEFNKLKVIPAYLAYEPPLTDEVAFELVEQILNGHPATPRELETLKRYGNRLRVWMNQNLLE